MIIIIYTVFFGKYTTILNVFSVKGLLFGAEELCNLFNVTDKRPILIHATLIVYEFLAHVIRVGIRKV